MKRVVLILLIFVLGVWGIAPTFRQNIILEVTHEANFCAEVTTEVEAKTTPSKQSVLIEVTPDPEYELFFTEEDVQYVAKMLFGEAPYCTEFDQRCCVWTVLNRVDSNYGFANIIDVVTAYYQYLGYDYYHPVREDLADLARDVMTEWSKEKCGIEIERELPRDYLWFSGNGIYNTYRNTCDFLSETRYISGQ